MEGGTGVYYQAMPAVGPDGKNVMKLIPVQKVNGQFYQTAFNTDRDNLDLKAYAKPAHPPAASSSQSQPRIPSLQPTTDGRYVLKSLPEVRTVPNSVKTQPTAANNLTIPTQNQAHVPLATKVVSQYAVHLPPQPKRQGMAAVQTLPVTVKSPVLPSGHFLQIPPNAKVRTLPATALPQSIKCRILNSVINTTSHEKAPPTVVLVSPVNSVKLNSDQQVVSLTKPSQIQKNLSQNPPLNLHTPISVPKTNEEVNTPIKWVIQEGTGASAPCLIPVSTPDVNSNSINTAKHSNSITANRPTPPQTGQEKIMPGKDNSLVMCNGKVYLVAKKNSEIAKGVMISEVGKQGLVSTSPALPASSALVSTSSKQDPKKVNVSEVIDLCDDDEEMSTCLGGAPGNLPTPSQTEVDESDEDCNVIFVSYIPPKSGEKEATAASQDTREEPAEISTKSVTQNEGDETAHKEIEESGADNSSATSDEVMDEQVRETEIAERNFNCFSESVNMEDDEMDDESTPETRCQDDGAVAEHESVLEEPQNVCVQATNDTEEVFENPTPDQRTQPKSDCQLRKEFGIICDVQIRLKRTKPTVQKDQQMERLIINKRTLDGLRKVIQESKLQSKIQQMMRVSYTNTGEDEDMKVKRKKQEQDGSRDIPSVTTNISPISLCSDVSVENDLDSRICQEDVCLQTESTADEVQSETSADSSPNSSRLTPLPEQKTASRSLSPSSARKMPPRSKKGKVCTACPCGTVLGAAGVTSPQEKANPCTVVESNKETRRSCLNKTPEECRPQPEEPVKKSGKKCLSRSPPKRKTPLGSATSHNISPDSSVNVTSNVSNQPGLSSSGSECKNTNMLSSSLDAGTSQNDHSLQTPSHNPSTPFSIQNPDPKIGKFLTQSLYTLETLDAEEIKRRERIERLKDLLKEKEAALERMQRSMNI